MHEQMKRLYEAAKVLKHVYGQSELARLFNVSPQTIHNWQARGISKQGMLKAQEIVGCSASWLETGTGQMSLGIFQVSPDMIGNNSQIPLISSEQAAKFSRTSRNSSMLNEPRTWLFTQLTLSARSFAMETSGTAMEPEFEEGDWIIVDPMIEPEPGDFVVARYGIKDIAILRKYRPRGLDASHRMLFELVPLNDDHPCIRSHIDSVEIIGTVTEHRKFRKKKAVRTGPNSSGNADFLHNPKKT